MIWWTITGSVITALVFILTGTDESIWTPFNTAGITALIYLVLMILFYTRKPLSSKFRIWSIILLFAVAGFTLYSWTLHYTMSNWQKNKLLEIRDVITKGIHKNVIKSPLLKTLDAYYNNPQYEGISIGSVFEKMYLSDSLGYKNLMQIIENSDSSAILHIAKVTDDEVLLVVQETYAKGTDPEFLNYNGTRGMIQNKGTLTAEGISYAREN